MEYLSEKLEDYTEELSSRIKTSFTDEFKNQYNEDMHKVKIYKENEEIVIIPQCKFIKLFMKEWVKCIQIIMMSNISIL